MLTIAWLLALIGLGVDAPDVEPFVFLLVVLTVCESIHRLLEEQGDIARGEARLEPIPRARVHR